MKRLVVMLALAACSEKSSPPPPQPAVTTPKQQQSVEARARQLVADLAAGKHADVVATFDANMAAALPAPQLTSTWNAVVAQAGAFESIEAVQIVKRGNLDAVTLTCKFKSSLLDINVAYDTDGKVAGLHLVPHTAAYTDPPYVDASKLVTRDVTVGSGEFALPGTLTLPKGSGPFRAVVLVHGSGPNDRDESVGANKPFRDLAGGLASRGIAVLRYDKRTKVHAAKLAIQPSFTLEQETIEDALAAVELLRGMKEIDAAHVVVVGHSLGGFAAPRIAAESHGHVAAIAILAGNTRDVPTAMIEQMEYIAKVDPSQAAAMPAVIADVKKAAARIAELQKGAAPKPGEMVLGAPAAYWLDLAKYDPTAVAAKLPQPIFVAQGGRDYQVTRAELDTWKRALASRKDVTFKLYPELNHLFGAGTGNSTPSEYATRTYVDLRVVTDLAAWISSL